MAALSHSTWRVCVPPDGSRRYYIDLKTQAVVWTLPASVPESSVSQFSAADEQYVPDEDLVPVSEVHHHGDGALRAASTAVAWLLDPARLSPLTRNPALRHLRECARAMGLAASHDVVLLLLAVALHPAYGRGMALPGLLDLASVYGWEARRLASSGYEAGETYFVNDLTGEQAWAAPPDFVDAPACTDGWVAVESNEHAAGGAQATLSKVVASLALGGVPFRSLVTTALRATQVQLAACRAASRRTQAADGEAVEHLAALLENTDGTALHERIGQLSSLVGASFPAAAAADGGSGASTSASTASSVSSYGFAGTPGHVRASLGLSLSAWVARACETDRGDGAVASVPLAWTRLFLPRTAASADPGALHAVLASYLLPALPAPTALSICEALVALGSAAHRCALRQLLLLPADAWDAAPVPDAGTLPSAATHGASGIRCAVRMCLRGLCAAACGPAVWSAMLPAVLPELRRRCPVAAGTDATVTSPGCCSAGVSGGEGAKRPAPSVVRLDLSDAAVAASVALSQSARAPPAAAVRRWLDVTAAALRFAASAAVSQAVAAWAVLSTGAAAGHSASTAVAAAGVARKPPARATGALNSRALVACFGGTGALRCAVAADEETLPWGRVARALLGCCCRYIVAAATPDAGETAGSGAAREQAAPVVAGAATVRASLAATVALHRLFELAACGLHDTLGRAVPLLHAAATAAGDEGGGPAARAAAFAAAEACSGTVREEARALGAGGSFGLITPVVQAAIGWLASPVAAAGGSEAVASSVRVQVSSQLVTILAEPSPADAIPASSSSLSEGGGGGRGGRVGAAAAVLVLDAELREVDVFAEATAVAEDVAWEAATAAAARKAEEGEEAAGEAEKDCLPAPAFPAGTWRLGRLAAASFLAALLQLSATPQPAGRRGDGEEEEEEEGAGAGAASGASSAGAAASAATTAVAAVLCTSDLHVTVDVCLRELGDLPVGDYSRSAWLRLLRSVVLYSQWFDGGSGGATEEETSAAQPQTVDEYGAPVLRHLRIGIGTDADDGRGGAGAYAARYRRADIAASLNALLMLASRGDGGGIGAAAAGLPHQVRDEVEATLAACRDLLED